MTGNLHSFIGRKTSARSTRPSSISIGTFQSMRMPSRSSVRSCNAAMRRLPLVIAEGYSDLTGVQDTHTCRPREGGDPYAAASHFCCGVWVPGLASLARDDSVFI